jgi:hypothetical protein
VSTYHIHHGNEGGVGQNAKSEHFIQTDNRQTRPTSPEVSGLLQEVSKISEELKSEAKRANSTPLFRILRRPPEFGQKVKLGSPLLARLRPQQTQQQRRSPTTATCAGTI